MAINFNEFFKELKVGAFSVYPSISDVLYAQSINLIPKFDVVYDDGRRKTLAIVSMYDAAKTIQYNNLSEKIEDAQSIEKNGNHNMVFKAIAPIITTWVNEGNCIACSRTLTSLFTKVAENENLPLSVLIDDITWQLNEEMKHTVNSAEKSSILLALKNLEHINC